MNPINKKLVTKLLSIVDVGLVQGVGVREPGKMCVEAAVCYALGQRHGDNPKCVAPCVRDFKISLNDSEWTSEATRAKGLRRVAVAQLGSKGIVKKSQFTREVLSAARRILLPPVLRKLGLSKFLNRRTLTQEERVDLGYGHTAILTRLITGKWFVSKDVIELADWMDDQNFGQRNRWLRLAADVCEVALRECKSPGVKFLHLCK